MNKTHLLIIIILFSFLFNNKIVFGETDPYFVGINYDNNKMIIKDINSNTSYYSFRSGINTVGNITFNDRLGNTLFDSDIVKTGDKMAININSVNHEYTLSVLGDIIGEGDITKNGVREGAKYLINKNGLNSANIMAIDMNHDGIAKVNDIVYLLKGLGNTMKSRIHFIDTGGSDAFLIESDGRYGLIDASNPSVNDNFCTTTMANAREHPSISNGTNLNNCYASCSSTMYGTSASEERTTVDHVIRYLNTVGVNKLDFVIATHNHGDHIGGMKDIANSKFVDSNTKYYYRDFTVTSEDYERKDWCNYELYIRSKEAMAAKGAQLIDVTNQNPQFKFGKFNIKLLNTEIANDDEYKTINYNGRSIYTINGENKNSIVTLLTYNDKKVLFAADMEAADEARLINSSGLDIQNLDILKMAHHGGNTSTILSFAKKASPNNIVVSRWGYPVTSSIGSVRYLQKNNILNNVYITGGVNEAIIVEFSNNGYGFSTLTGDTNIENAKVNL